MLNNFPGNINSYVVLTNFTQRIYRMKFRFVVVVVVFLNFPREYVRRVDFLLEMTNVDHSRMTDVLRTEVEYIMVC